MSNEHQEQIAPSNLWSSEEKLSPQDQQHLFDEVRQALRQFEGPEGFVAPAEMLLAVGTR